MVKQPAGRSRLVAVAVLDRNDCISAASGRRDGSGAQGRSIRATIGELRGLAENRRTLARAAAWQNLKEIGDRDDRVALKVLFGEGIAPEVPDGKLEGLIVGKLFGIPEAHLAKPLMRINPTWQGRPSTTGPARSSENPRTGHCAQSIPAGRWSRGLRGRRELQRYFSGAIAGRRRHRRVSLHRAVPLRDGGGHVQIAIQCPYIDATRHLVATTRSVRPV